MTNGASPPLFVFLGMEPYLPWEETRDLVGEWVAANCSPLWCDEVYVDVPKDLCILVTLPELQQLFYHYFVSATFHEELYVKGEYAKCWRVWSLSTTDPDTRFKNHVNK